MKNKFKKIDLTLIYSLVIIILVNLISIFFFIRFDMTEGKIFSLSEASKKIVSKLDDKVIVKCFFSKELPPQLKSIPTLVKDNLDEYKTYSNGNFLYEFIDQEDNNFADQIADYQLPSAQVQMLEKDEFKVKRIFMGIVMIYEDKKEIIPFIQEGDLPTLEYEITSRIKKLTSERLAEIGILSGFGSTETENIRNAYQLLSEQYVVRSVSANETELNPDNLAALIVLSPKENITQEGLKAIDKYISGGGKTAFFMDKTDVDIQKQNVKEIVTNLDSLMAVYGVKVNTDLIGDKECGLITVRQQKGFFTIANQMKYPFLPVIKDLDKTNPVTNKIESVSLFFASSLDTTGVSDKDIKLNIIAKTSENSFLQKKNFNIIADKDIADYKYDNGNIPVIATLKGSFSSFFDPQTKSADTRMVIAGDAEFFHDGKMTSEDNLNLFLNLIDWLTAEEELISIRSKVITQRPLDKVEDTGKIIIKAINIALIPLLIAFLGFFKWQTGKRRKDFSLK